MRKQICGEFQSNFCFLSSYYMNKMRKRNKIMFSFLRFLFHLFISQSNIYLMVSFLLITFSHLCFCLHHNLFTLSKLSPHSTRIIISSLSSVIVHWRRRRLTMLSCDKVFSVRSIKIIFQQNASFDPSLWCSFLPDLIADVRWEILYLSGPIVRDSEGLAGKPHK